MIKANTLKDRSTAGEHFPYVESFAYRVEKMYLFASVWDSLVKARTYSPGGVVSLGSQTSYRPLQ